LILGCFTAHQHLDHIGPTLGGDRNTLVGSAYIICFIYYILNCSPFVFSGLPLSSYSSSQLFLSSSYPSYALFLFTHPSPDSLIFIRRSGVLARRKIKKTNLLEYEFLCVLEGSKQTKDVFLVDVVMPETHSRARGVRYTVLECVVSRNMPET
jgi:hypothetical protein